MKIQVKNYVARWNGQTRKFVVMKADTVGVGEVVLTRAQAREKAKLLNAKEKKISAKLKKAAVSHAEMAS